jgi:hypothetical protein
VWKPHNPISFNPEEKRTDTQALLPLLHALKVFVAKGGTTNFDTFINICNVQLWRFNVAGDNKTYLGLHVKSHSFARFQPNLDFLDRFSWRSYQMSRHPSSGSRGDTWGRMDRQKDRWTDMAKLTGAFRDCAKESYNGRKPIKHEPEKPTTRARIEVEYEHEALVTHTARFSSEPQCRFQQGCTNFLKIWQPPQDSTCQMGHIKQAGLLTAQKYQVPLYKI